MKILISKEKKQTFNFLSKTCKINIIFLTFTIYFCFVLGQNFHFNNLSVFSMFPIFFNLGFLLLFAFLFINYPIIKLLNKKNVIIQNLINKNTEIETIVKSLKNENSILNENFIKTKEQIKNFETKILILKNNEGILNQKIQYLKLKIETLEKQIKTLKLENDELNNKNTQLFDQQEKLKEKMNTFKFYLLNLLVINNNHLNNKFKSTLKKYLTKIENYLK